MTCFTFKFDEKVTTVRASTADAPSPMFSTAPLNRSVAHCVISGHWPSPTSSLLSICFWTSSARPIPCRRMSWRNISMNWHRISSNCSIVRYSKASFQRYSKRHSSRHCWRSLSLIRPMSKRTDPSRTCRCCRNCSKGWSSSGRQHRISDAPVSVGTATITPVHSFRDIGIYVDSAVTMRSHICCQNRIELFRHPTPNSQHPSISHEAGTANARCLIGVDAIGLRQCNSRRSASPATRQTQVRHECSRQTGLLCPEVRSCDSASARSSLHGYVHRRESNTVWRCWRSVVNKVRLHCTCHLSSSACLMLFPVDACGLR